MAGEITNVTVTPIAISRNGVEVTIDHTDTSTWDGGNGRFRAEYSLDGPAGPWTAPADVQTQGNHCNDSQTNDDIIGGCVPNSPTQTCFTIFDPAIPHDADIWVQITALLINTPDPESGGDVEVAQGHTEDYPAFGCGGANPTTDSGTMRLLNAGGQPNVSGCDADSITWEWGTTAGGPYPNTVGPNELTDFTPDEELTGLDPDTTYFWRARLSEQVDTNGEYVVTDECSFTTLAEDNQPPTITGLDDQSGPVGDELCDDFDVADPDGTVDSVTAAPVGATLTDNGGGSWTICFTPAAEGDTTFTITVTDDEDAETTGDITFTGTAAPSEPPGPPTFPGFDPGDECVTGDGGDGTPPVDVEQNLLCDVVDGETVGTALAVYEYDEAGNPTGPPTFVDPVTGDPYVVQGTLQRCPGAQSTGTAELFLTCEDVPREAIVTGPNLVDNGDFADSEGIGASSTFGPGFSTEYVAPNPCDNIFAAACTGGSGGGHMAFFNTNAGQVTGDHIRATPIQALSTKSLAVNVGPDVDQAIISWQVPLVSGQEYEIGADVAIINQPYGIKLTADDVDVLDLTAPDQESQWQRRTDRFVYTGPSGLVTLALKSNTGEPAGNDHTFDNFTLREVTPAQDPNLTEVDYNDTFRAVVDQIVQTTGCNDDRRDGILANIAAAAGSPANQVVLSYVCVDGETWARVDLYEVGAGSVVDSRWFGPNGDVETEPAAFTHGECPAGGITTDDECVIDRQGDGTAVLAWRRTTTDEDGNVTVTLVDEGGDPYVPTGTLEPCGGEGGIDVEIVAMCDDGETTFLRHVVYDPEGQVDSTFDTEADGTTPYVPTGTVTIGECVSPDDPIEVNSRIVMLVGDIPAEDTWGDPAGDPSRFPAPGTLISVTVTVLSGPGVQVIDQNFSDQVLLPTGASVSFSTNDDRNLLNGPAAIQALPGATAIVAWTVRA